MSISPPIDKRDFEALLDEMTKRVPFYTPEWKVTDERGLDSAILKIFVQMLSDTIQRLNQVPQKNFIAFLDALGVNLLPALPARVPLTFYLSNGTTTSVVIPQKTQVAASPVDGGEPISFETEKTILATPAKLVDAYSVNPQQDEIFRVPSGFLGEEAIAPFTTQLLFPAQSREKKLFFSQKAELQVGDFLKIGEGKFAEYVEVAKVTENKVELKEGLQKPHNNESNNQLVQKVVDFELFAGKNQQNHIIYLGHKNIFKIKDAVIIKLFFSTWNNSFVDSSFLIWEYYGKVDESQEPEWYSFDAWEKDSETDTLILSKNNLNMFQEIDIHGIKTFWIRGRVLSPDFRNDLNQEQKKSFDARIKTIKIDTIRVLVESFSEQVTTENTGIQPDLLFYNDIPLSNTNFYPFGQKSRLFDTFYLASQAAFSQPNCKVVLHFSVEGSIPASATPVIRVQGIGEEFASRLQNNGINFVSELRSKTAEELAQILETNQSRAENILDAARREFYDRGTALNLIFLESIPVLSWEYWNGKGWVKLNLDKDSISENFVGPVQQTIQFNCPPDLAEIVVNGQPNYWIRVRLVSGDYGKETFSVEDGEIKSKDNFHPPKILDCQISYQPQEELGFPLEVCLTLNNLTFQNRTEESKIADKLFQPFQPIEDNHQALYLGFDAPPIQGPISLFAALEIQEYTEQNRPRVEWEYFRIRNGQREWTPLTVIDETNHLTQSGLVQWLGQEDFAIATYFGQTLYWIRAVDVANQFQPLERSLNQNTAKVVKLFPAKLRKVSPPAPRFQGLHLNTAWAIQAESLSEQILGSSDGTINQRFSFLKFPVIAEEVWVNEITALSTGERAALFAQKGDRAIIEETDENDNTTAFWVRWDAVEDILDSTPSDRYYHIDRTFGLLEFGDGITGAIPPIGTDNIRANYQAGGGSKGNVAVGTINILKSAIAFVERATNWQSAGGGSDTESVERALVRGAQQIRHQNRAVTAQDFEQLALQASRSIARVKCLPNFNDAGETETGWVTVLIVPQSSEPQPQLSPILRQQVENYLRERSTNVITAPKHLVVTRPVYAEVNVTTTLIAVSLDKVPQVEKAALEKLNAFLHPLTGGYNDQGWEFGRLPCESDFYQILEDITGVDHVDFLDMTPSLEIQPYSLVASGQHQVTVQVLLSSES